jgi:hypothetical protein
MHTTLASALLSTSLLVSPWLHGLAFAGQDLLKVEKSTSVIERGRMPRKIAGVNGDFGGRAARYRTEVTVHDRAGQLLLQRRLGNVHSGLVETASSGQGHLALRVKDRMTIYKLDGKRLKEAASFGQGRLGAFLGWNGSRSVGNFGWNPQGTHLVVAEEKQGVAVDYHVFDARSGTSRPLTSRGQAKYGPYGSAKPIFSQNGRFVALLSATSTHVEVFDVHTRELVRSQDIVPPALRGFNVPGAAKNLKGVSDTGEPIVDLR